MRAMASRDFSGTIHHVSERLWSTWIAVLSRAALLLDQKIAAELNWQNRLCI
jgi:hypothetical protein